MLCGDITHQREKRLGNSGWSGTVHTPLPSILSELVEMREVEISGRSGESRCRRGVIEQSEGISKSRGIPWSHPLVFQPMDALLGFSKYQTSAQAEGAGVQECLTLHLPGLPLFERLKT